MGYIIEAADRFTKIDRSETSMIADMLIEELAKTFETKPVADKPSRESHPETSKTFEIGSEYYGVFVCDSDSCHFIKVTGRTPKQLKFVNVYNGEPEAEEHRVKIFYSDGVEYILPFGKYSMALSVYASRKVEKE